MFWTAVLLALAIVVFPIFWLFLSSLKTKLQIDSRTPLFIFEPSFVNYVDVFQRTDLARFLFNSVIVAGGTTALALLIGPPAAYGLTRFRFPGAETFLAGVLLTRMFPAVAIGMPLYLIASNLKIMDTLPLLIAAKTSGILPLTIWLMTGFFARIPTDLDDAARADGCSWFGAYRRVVLPLTAPGLAATGILAFLYGWNELFFPLTLGPDRARTGPVFIILYIDATIQVSWGSVAAGAMVLIVLPLVLGFVAQRYLVDALTAGAVKG